VIEELAAVDVRGLLKACLGRLGWTPETFWQAAPRDCWAALEGYWDEMRERRKFESARAAFIVNATRDAYHAERFKPVEGTDFYDPDEESKRSDAERAAEKDDLVSSFPDTL
jgi:hypothetical protein